MFVVCPISEPVCLIYFTTNYQLISSTRSAFRFGVDYDSPRAKCGQGGGVYKIYMYMDRQVYDWTVNSNN